MSYSIEYNPEKKKIYPIPSSRKPRWLILVIVALITLFVLQKLDKSHAIKSWLLPGNPEITAAAFSSMVADIRDGESVGDAVTAFCLEIIKNG